METGLPPTSMLDKVVDRSDGYSGDALEAMSRLVELKLLDFGVDAEVVEVHPGPVITRFELQLAAGIKVSKVSNLAKDLARALSVVSVRIVEVIPGKSQSYWRRRNNFTTAVRQYCTNNTTVFHFFDDARSTVIPNFQSPL